jgi:hypothetical protein
MGEKIIAGITILVCVVLLLRLCVGERLRYRFDATVRHAWLSLRRSALRLWHWRASRRRAEQRAQQEADAAIKQAQRKAASAFQRDGNVYKPDAFLGSKLDPKLEPKPDQRDPRNLH